MEIGQYNTMMKSLRREKKLEEALKHIEGMCVFENICVTELTRKEALNTITWIRERAREALEQEV